MYRCDICGFYFDEPDFASLRDYHSEVDAYEQIGQLVCPVCGSDEFREEEDL